MREEIWDRHLNVTTWLISESGYRPGMFYEPSLLHRPLAGDLVEGNGVGGRPTVDGLDESPVMKFDQAFRERMLRGRTDGRTP